MGNPFESLSKEIQEVKELLADVKQSIPKSQPLKRYTPQEVAEATGVSVQTIWNALNDGRIQGKKFGKRYLISVDEFDRACDEIKTIKFKRS